MDDVLRNNYLRKVLAMLHSGPRSSGVYEIEVVHAESCGFLNGLGYCDCDPEIRPWPESKN